MMFFLAFLVFVVLVAITFLIVVSKNKAVTITDSRNVETISRRKIVLTLEEAIILASNLNRSASEGKNNVVELKRKENPSEILAFIVK